MKRFLNKVPQVIGNHFIHDTIHSCRHVYDVVDRLRGRGSGRGWERAGLPGAKLGPRREAGVRGVDRRRGKRSTIHTLSKAFCVLNVNKVRAPFSGDSFRWILQIKLSHKLYCFLTHYQLKLSTKLPSLQMEREKK